MEERELGIGVWARGVADGSGIGVKNARPDWGRLCLLFHVPFSELVTDPHPSNNSHPYIGSLLSIDQISALPNKR